MGIGYEVIEVLGEPLGLDVLLPHRKIAPDDDAAIEAEEILDELVDYEIVTEGNDVKPGEKDTVYVHYTGTLIDGTEFDASDREKDPVRMLMNRVIKGWTEGLQYIGEGGRIKLYIPAELGYGSRGTGLIKPNSTLVFDVELAKVNKFVEKEDKTDKK